MISPDASGTLKASCILLSNQLTSMIQVVLGVVSSSKEAVHAISNTSLLYDTLLDINKTKSFKSPIPSLLSMSCRTFTTDCVEELQDRTVTGISASASPSVMSLLSIMYFK